MYRQSLVYNEIRFATYCSQTLYHHNSLKNYDADFKLNLKQWLTIFGLHSQIISWVES